MPLPTFLQRKKPEPPARRAAAAAESEDSGAVQAARTRARRRLIGAVVLLAVGIVVFPLVFETQPRPIATDVPIEVPARKDGGTVAPARPVTRRPVPPAEVPAEAPVEPAPQVAAAASAAPEPAPAPPVAAPKPAEPREHTAAAAPKPSAPAATPKPAVVAKVEEAQRAKSLLEGKPAASPPPASAAKEGRFVVQVGAFTDAAALKDARQRVEKLGLKTYTQVVETDAGKRTRVRVGPFATREEADHAAAKLKGAALPAAVLTL